MVDFGSRPNLKASHQGQPIYTINLNSERGKYFVVCYWERKPLKDHEQDRDIWKIAVQCISVGPFIHCIDRD